MIRSARHTAVMLLTVAASHAIASQMHEIRAGELRARVELLNGSFDSLAVADNISGTASP